MAKVDNNNNPFQSLIGDYVEEQDTSFFDYKRVTLAEIGADEYYQGKPQLSEISSMTFDNDGIEETKYRCQLFLIDDEEEEFLQININLKTNDDLQKGIHYKSSLYKLIGGIMNQITPGWTDDNNIIVQSNLKEFRDYIDTLESMTILIKEVEGSDFNYLTFSVTEIQ